MLRTLSIRDVVLIDRLDLDFHPGLCVLTGETGAGKSILLDALGLALGSRAEARLVRHGAAQASVTAVFEPAAGHSVHELLAGHGIGGGADGDGGLILRRVLGADGRTRAFVNDQPVSVSLLRQVADTLAETHGQFESQRLLSPANHRDLLDAYGGLAPERGRVREACLSWHRASDARARAGEELEAARRDEEFLRYAVDELAALDPQPGEEETLARQRSVMMHGEKVLDALNQAAEELQRDSGVEAALRGAVRHLERVAEMAGGRLDDAVAALDRAATEVTEGTALLERASTAMDVDPRGLEVAEERLFALRALARKHGTDVDNLSALGEDLRSRLAALDDDGAALARLEHEEAAARAAFVEAAAVLSAARRDAADRLDRAMVGELSPLKLEKATFVTRVEPLGEDDWGEAGCDRAAFEVATNPGMPAGPLNRIASGGELARFMLALKVVLAGADPVPTIVFDEVDSGVGGAVAAAVGERLVRLAGEVQVLVVTHSPQVAARGAHHWRVSKAEAAPGTLTSVDALNEAARKEEIACMLAGARVTDEARAAADSLLAGEPA
jgi:DNA repair protein RecN (Recombination protein N)